MMKEDIIYLLPSHQVQELWQLVVNNMPRLGWLFLI